MVDDSHHYLTRLDVTLFTGTPLRVSVTWHNPNVELFVKMTLFQDDLPKGTFIFTTQSKDRDIEVSSIYPYKGVL